MLSFKESQSKLDMRYEQLISELEKENREDESKVLDAYRLLINDPEIVEMVDEDQNLTEIFQVLKTHQIKCLVLKMSILNKEPKT